MAALLMAGLHNLAPPRWETNDDVAMSMIVHGYGIAAPGSPPQLMFSNVLWGYLARSIPSVGSFLGYSFATIGSTFLACAGTLYGLSRVGVSRWMSFAAVALVFMRPILFPQFTLNAGLLAIAALTMWMAFTIDRHKWVLVLAACCAFLSYLVRSQEFLLVLAVALPLLAARPLRMKAVQVALVVLAIAISAAGLFDFASYRTEQWREFNTLNPARARLTDFRAGESLRQHPEIARGHGFSLNDIELVEQWFFVDPNITDPVRLKALLSEASEQPVQDGFNVAPSLRALSHQALWMLIAVAVLGTSLWPGKKLLLAWAVFLAGIVAIGMVGRPGVIRVYLPAVGLLVMATLVQAAGLRNIRTQVFAVALGAAVVANAAVVVGEAKALRIVDAADRSRMVGFPSYPVIVWAVGLPFEAIYPPFGASPDAMQYKLYGLGVSTLAPFSIAQTERKAGRGMVDRLLSPDGAPLLATEKSLRLLAVYCREHHRADLQQVGEVLPASAEPPRYRCAAR